VLNDRAIVNCCLRERRYLLKVSPSEMPLFKQLIGAD
jgi:hypothetical protein